MPKMTRGLKSYIKDAIHAQVAVPGSSRPNAEGFISHARMQGRPICLAEDRDGWDAQPSCSGDDAAGDLAAICDQQLSDPNRTL